MKTVRIHKVAAKEIAKFNMTIRTRLAELLDLVAHGQSLSMPLSRPMPSIANGAHELRIKDRTGQYRVFYFVKVKEEILVFHCFQKKTQATPMKEIELAKKRLKEIL